MLLKYHGVNDDFSDYSWYDNLYSLILHHERILKTEMISNSDIWGKLARIIKHL